MASLKAYAITRALLTIPTVLILLTLVFIVMRALPGNPFLASVGEHAKPEQIEAMIVRYGLDKPIHIQYANYLFSIFRGDLGDSLIFSRRPVWDEIAEKFPATIELTIAAMLVALLVGILGGVQSAYRRNSAVDYGVRIYGNIIYSIPIFWLGIVLQVIFGVYLHILPTAGRISSLTAVPHPLTLSLGSLTVSTSGYFILSSILTGNLSAFLDSITFIILPALTLGLVLSGVFTRITRANMIDVLKRDFIAAARARGIKERDVVYDHALKNAAVPIFTMIGLQFALLLAGAVLTETVFSWPGIGRYLWERIQYRDFPAVQGVIIVYAFLVSATSTVVDILYAVLDPRIRL